MKKIDIHIHVMKNKGIYNYKDKNDTFVNADEIIGIYEGIGIEKGVILPLVSPECANQIQSNEEVLEIVKAFPDKFYWFCNIDPRFGSNSPDTDMSYFLEYYKGLGAKGVGEICANLYFDDPYMENLFYHCEKADMPVLFHIGKQIGGCYGIADELGLYRLEKELVKFSKLKFLGHSQAFWPEISLDVTNENRGDYPGGRVVPGRIVELMRKYPNLYGDLSAGSGYNAVSRDLEFGYGFIEEFQDRLFFGTDICSPKGDAGMPLSSWLDDALKNSKLSRQAYEKVSRENILKLFRS